MKIERRRRKIIMNITPMIDVIFILLIFFLVTTSFSDLPGLDIELPAAASARQPAAGELVLTVSAGGGLFLNRQPVLRGDLLRLLEAETAGGKDQVLILKADREIPYGLAVEIMDLSRQAGLKKIVALTNPSAAERTP